MYRVLRQDEHADTVARSEMRRMWLCAALAFLLLAVFAPLHSGGDEGRGGNVEPAPDLGQIEQAFERVVERVSPSVVGIRVRRRYMAAVPSGQAATTGGLAEQLVTVNGSGTVIDPSGLILTNEHVVQSATEIEVFAHDGETLTATLVAADARGDLAVLKVDRDDLVPARMVDWSEVARGQWTIAIGNPYGLGSDGNLSVSVGVIANLGRRLPGLGEVDDRFYTNMIQTTAAIHPGCSGGPLFNIRGELVGVVAAMHTRAPADEGVGFAIPMTPAKRLLIQALRDGKPVVYGYIGLTVRSVEPGERQPNGLGPQVGAVVQRIDPAGPADEAGVRVGDLILRFDGQLVRGPGSLAESVGQTPPGSTVPLELRRGELRLAVHATVQRRQVSRVSWMRGGAVLWRGMRLTDLSPLVRQKMSVNVGAVGVVVIDVTHDSPAEKAAIRIGDVIQAVAESSVYDTVGFQKQVRGHQGPVKIRVLARGELLVRP